MRWRLRALATACLVAVASSSARGQEIERPDSSFRVVGGAVGTPGYLNVVAGYFGPRRGVQLSAGTWTHGRVGAQAALIWRTIQSPDFSLGPALLLGTFGTRADSADATTGSRALRQIYVGPAFDLYLSGFHLQAGIAYGFRDYPQNPQLLLQTGYLFRLR